MTLASPPLPLTRLNVTRAEVGILRVVAGASVTIYDTMSDGSSPVLADGSVQVGALKTVLFADRGMVSTKANPVIADSQGLVEFYTRKSDVHIQVVALDGTMYGIPWYAAPVVEDEISVLDFVSVQAAIDATPIGGTLKFPEWAGPYSPPTASPWVLNKGITLVGSGFGSNEAYIKYFTTGGVNGHKNSSVFEVAANNITIEGFTISSGVGITEYDGTGDAIRFVSASNKVITNLKIRNCNILYAGRNAVRLAADSSINSYVVGVLMYNVNAFGCGQDGYWLKSCTVASVHEVWASRNNGMGIYFYDVRGVVTACVGEDNHCRSGVGTYGNNADYAAQFHFEICHGLSITGCHIETLEQASGVKTGICINAGDGNVIEGCTIGCTAITSGSRSIQFINGSQGCRVGVNNHGAVDICVNVQNDGTVYDLVVEPQSNLFGSAPNAKGQLNIPDTTRSFIYVTDYDGSGLATNKGVGLCFPGVAVGSIGAAAKRKRMLFFDDTANQWAYYDNTGALHHITGIGP